MSTKAKKDPFKTRKTKTVVAPENDTITPPEQIKAAIDAFREAQDQAKHFEGEATVQKDIVVNYAQEEFSKRSTEGQSGSFKMLGDDAMVTYIVQDSSAGLTEDEVDEITQRWGETVTEQLIQRDFRSIRFDAKVLEAHYDEVVAALQTLPENVLENLFKPMLLKAAPGAIDKAKQHVKSPEELRELMTALKIKNYIR